MSYIEAGKVRQELTTSGMNGSQPVQLLRQQSDMAVFFFDDFIDGFFAGRIAGKLFQSAVEHDGLFGPSDRIPENFLSVPVFERAGFCRKDRQARHDVGVGQDVIVRIERPELAGLLRESLSSLDENLLVTGLPGRQLIARIAKIRVVEHFRRVKVELRAVVLDFFGYLENLEDIKLRLHDRSLPQRTLPLFSRGSCEGRLTVLPRATPQGYPYTAQQI